MLEILPLDLAKLKESWKIPYNIANSASTFETKVYNVIVFSEVDLNLFLLQQTEQSLKSNQEKEATVVFPHGNKKHKVDNNILYNNNKFR